MADDRYHPPSMRELEERSIRGTKGPRDAKSVLAATRELRRLEKREAERIAQIKRAQSTDEANR